MFLALILMCAKSEKGDKRYANELELANMMVYINEEVPYGEKTSVVLTVERFPRRPLQMRLSTTKYLLVYRKLGSHVPEMPPKFKRSWSISNILESLKIKPTISVEYETGYYANVQATFWDRDDTVLRLEFSVPSRPSLEPSIVEVSFKVAPPKAECVPVLKMSGCQNPQTPQKVVLLRSTILRAHFVEKCGIKDAVLTWNLFDLAETSECCSSS